MQFFELIVRTTPGWIMIFIKYYVFDEKKKINVIFHLNIIDIVLFL